MIRRIRIRNFKSLRDVTVDLSPVTVLIGRSGTGKTNFVDAIRFLRDYVRNGKIEGRWKEEFDQLLCRTQQADDAFSFEVDFTVPEIEFPFTYSLAVDGKHASIDEPRWESLTSGDTVHFSQKTQYRFPEGVEFPQSRESSWVHEPRTIPPTPCGKPALGRLPGLEEVVSAQAFFATGIGVHHFAPSVLSRRSGSNGGAEAIDGLSDDGTNHLDVLRRMTQDPHGRSRRAGVRAVLQYLNRTIVSVELDDLVRPHEVIVSHEVGDSRLLLPLSSQSDGLRRICAHLLALYQAPSKQLLVFEEPENGIYPGALAVLADEFEAAPRAHGTQVLLTTHSPQLLDRFKADQIRVVELDEHLETRIGLLAPEQRECLEEQILFPGELLTADPARLGVGA